MIWDERFRGQTFEVPTDKSDEIHCPVCNRLWAKGSLGTGTLLEMKCRGCKQFVNLKVV